MLRCETGGMSPVLEPNPKNSQKKMLLVFTAMLGITVVIGVIASIAAP
ncbi:SGM_5486 family transporter-associated protein [Streptomyces sp. NPDC060194]